MIDDSIAIIKTHANSTNRLLDLTKLIVELKKLDKKILVVSHYYLPEYIQKEIDFFIFDKNNTFIKSYDIICDGYFDENTFKIKSKDYFSTESHFYAHYRLLSESLHFCKSIGVKYAHIFDSDLTLNNSKIIIENDSHIKSGVDGVFYRYESYVYKEINKNSFDSNYMCINVEKMCDIFPILNSGAEYIKLHYDGEKYLIQFESVLSDKILENKEFKYKLFEMSTDITYGLSTYDTLYESCFCATNTDELYLFVSPHKETDCIFIHNGNAASLFSPNHQWNLLRMGKLSTTANLKFLSKISGIYKEKISYNFANDIQRHDFRVNNEIFFKDQNEK